MTQHRELKQLSKDFGGVASVYARLKDKIPGVFDALTQLGVIFALREVRRSEISGNLKMIYYKCRYYMLHLVK